MGGVESKGKPWVNFEAYSSTLFTNNFERVNAVVSSISSAPKQSLFYHPKLCEMFKHLPHVGMAEVTWDQNGQIYFENQAPAITPQTDRVVMRVTAAVGDGAHDIVCVYMVKNNELVFIDSQSFHSSYHEQWKQNFEKFIQDWLAGFAKSNCHFVYPSCPSTQFLSFNCSSWSFFHAACIIIEGTDPIEYISSKSPKEFNMELKCFIAWVYKELLKEELLEEKMFKQKDKFQKLSEYFCNEPFVPTIESGWNEDDETIIKIIGVERLRYIQRRHSWKDVLIHLSFAYHNDDQEPFIKLQSDFVDPNFFDENCDCEVKEKCEKCGNWCMSTAFSVCKEEKNNGQVFYIPNPKHLEKYQGRQDNDYETWLKAASPLLHWASVHGTLPQ